MWSSNSLSDFSIKYQTFEIWHSKNQNAVPRRVKLQKVKIKYRCTKPNELYSKVYTPPSKHKAITQGNSKLTDDIMVTNEFSF